MSGLAFEIENLELPTVYCPKYNVTWNFAARMRYFDHVRLHRYVLVDGKKTIMEVAAERYLGDVWEFMPTFKYQELVIKQATELVDVVLNKLWEEMLVG